MRKKKLKMVLVLLMVVISKSYAAEVVIRGQKPLKIKEKIIIKVEEVSLDDLWFDSLALKQEKCNLKDCP